MEWLGRLTCISVLLLLLLVHSVLASPTSNDGCTVCKDGSSVPLVDKLLKVMDGGVIGSVETCGDLEEMAQFLVIGTVLCDRVQAIGTLCGCRIEQGACTLCSNGSKAPNATKELPSHLASDFSLAPTDAIIMTCETLEAVLHNQQQNDSRCLSIQQEIATECGCDEEADQENADNNSLSSPSLTNDKNKVSPAPSSTPSPSLSPSPSNAPKEPCPLCPYGGTIKFSNKTLMDIGDGLPVNNCADLALFASFLTADSQECLRIQYLGYRCGCDAPEEACSFCPNGEPVPKPQQTLGDGYLTVVSDSYRFFSGTLTCETMESALKAPSLDSLLAENVGMGPDYVCLSMQLKSQICGCSPSWRAKLLTWTYRTTAFLSLIASLAIITSIVSLDMKRRTSTYHQLVLGMSVFDLVSSAAYLFAGVAIPRERGSFQAMGNVFTCKLQGFFIQVGVSSVLYNLGLSIYFLLVICHNWKESRFERLQKYMHLLVVGIGFGFALGSLPFIGDCTQFANCFIQKPPGASNWTPVIIFFSLPVSMVLVVTTFVTIFICFRVYRQQVFTRRYSTRQDLALTRKVFWQSVWYMLAFYFSLPVLLMSYHWYFMGTNDFFILVLGAILVPSHGTLNALVFFQRTSKLDEYVANKAKRLSSRISFSLGNTSSTFNFEEARVPEQTPEFMRHTEAASNEFFQQDEIDDGQSSNMSMVTSNAVPLSLLTPPPPRLPPTPPRKQQSLSHSQVSTVVSSRPEDVFEATRDHWRLNVSKAKPKRSRLQNYERTQPSELSKAVQIRGAHVWQLRLQRPIQKNKTAHSPDRP